MKAKTRVSPVDTEAPESSDRQCNGCPTSAAQHLAPWFCYECNRFICSSLKNDHQKFQLLACHKIITEKEKILGKKIEKAKILGMDAEKLSILITAMMSAFKIFTSVMGSFLVLFVPQQCTLIPSIPRECTISENLPPYLFTTVIRTQDGQKFEIPPDYFNASVLCVNLLTFLLVVGAYTVAQNREYYLEENFDVNGLLPDVNLSKTLDQERPDLSKKLDTLNRRTKNWFGLALAANLLNAILSAVVCLGIYPMGSKSYTVFFTNAGILVLKILSDFLTIRESTIKRNALSLQIKEPKNFNDFDQDTK